VGEAGSKPTARMWCDKDAGGEKYREVTAWEGGPFTRAPRKTGNNTKTFSFKILTYILMFGKILNMDIENTGLILLCLLQILKKE
jgi:hypothetical protein